jgi:hypothetical protein
VRRLHPELWRQKNWLLRHDNAPFHTSFSTREFFTQHNMTIVPHSPYFSLFPPIEDKMKGHTTEMIEAESQAVLNTLTEHGFQDTFKKWQNCREQCIRAEGDNFEGNGCQ